MDPRDASRGPINSFPNVKFQTVPNWKFALHFYMSNSLWKGGLMDPRDASREPINSFPNVTFQTVPNWKFSDDNFEFDENGKKLSELVENTEGKEEIAFYEQFLLFP